MPSNQSPSPRRILAVPVVVAGIVSGVLAEVFPLLFRPLGIVSGRLFADAIMTAVSSLAPMVFVFAACRRAAITRLRKRTIAGIALIGGIVGRYAGTAIGSVLAGQEVPSPVVEFQAEHTRLPVRRECSDGCRNRVTNRRVMKPRKVDSNHGYSMTRVSHGNI
jgi:hypothetical protein